MSAEWIPLIQAIGVPVGFMVGVVGMWTYLTVRDWWRDRKKWK